MPGLLDGITIPAPTRTRRPPAIEVGDCVAACRGLPEAGLDRADGRPDAGADQREESGDQRPPRPERLPLLVQRLRQQRPGRRATCRQRDQRRHRRDRPRSAHRDQQLPAALRHRSTTRRQSPRPRAATPGAGRRRSSARRATDLSGRRDPQRARDHARQRRHPVRPEGAALRRHHRRRVRHAERDDRRHRPRLELHARAPGPTRAALEIAYRAGIVAERPAATARPPIIDLRGWDDQGIHHQCRSFSSRARLDREYRRSRQPGDLAVRHGPAADAAHRHRVTLESFVTMDGWLTALETRPRRRSIGPHRSAGAQRKARRRGRLLPGCWRRPLLTKCAPRARN